jgi:imidazolonepropionase-like amidohydrolase
MLAIKAGKLIDGSGEVHTDMTILVEGEEIQQVGKTASVEIPRDAPVIDASDQTVMPGMVDAHLHVMSSGDPEEEPWVMRAVTDSIGTLAFKSYVNAKRDLEAGFTTIRDAGNFAYVDVALRDAIDEGMLVGPRMKVAGIALSMTGGHMDRTKGLAPHVSIGELHNIVDSPAEGRKAARYQIKMGADFIKIAATLSEYVRKSGGLCSQELTFESMQAICQVAHRAGRTVAAHCHGGEGVKAAIRAGVDSLEHGRFLTDEILEMMVEHGTYLVPTMSPEGRAMAQGRREKSDADWNWFCKAYDAMFDTVARAHAAGVKVAIGSDAAMPFVRHGESAYEMELFVEAGLSPMEAIVAGTQIGAEVLGMAAQIGTLKPGKWADIVIVDGDPLADITVLQEIEKIKRVIKGGETVVERH